jgi:penicillin amidase/acyl-homoserine-lactone acylase
MVEQWYRMNKARTFDEWRAAMRLGALPMFNSGYADRDGNVAYFYGARLPRRDPRYDWSDYLPGDTTETLWGDYLPWDDLPQVVNPPSGVVWNANSSPFEVTPGEGNPDPARYPESHGIERHLTNRALRLQELLGSDNAISREAFDRYKMDVAYSRRSGLAKRVATLLDGPQPGSPRLREALLALGRWDLRANPENPLAALALFTLRPRFDNRPPPTDRSDLLGALEASAERLRESFGRLDVPWSEVLRLRRGTLDLGLAGAPDTLRAIYSQPAEDGRLEGISGDCYILHVEWSPTGEVRSRSIHQFGSATLESTSRHYADQAPLFARGEWKPVRLDEAELRPHLTREYRPGQVGR